MMGTETVAPVRRDEFRMGDGEFVGLMAAIMALNALAIDSMLPAFPAIAETFGIADHNRMQHVLSSYLMANAVGSLVAGPLSDRFGRRRMLLGSILSCALFGLASAIAPSFEMLLVTRVLHGFVAASLGVLTISVIRDRYTGDRMAKLMSLVFIVFMVVPVLAPSMGAVVMAVAGWREIFHVLAVAAVGVLAWTWLRLPETLHAADRQKIALGTIARNWGTVMTDRLGAGYMMGAGIMMGGLFGFLLSAQQIFTEVFNAAAIFPIAFGCVAGTMAFANFSNSRIVERFGARRVSHCALLVFILIGIAQLVAAQMHPEPMLLFLVLVALTMGMVGFTGANFGSIAMEPFGHIAGTASSFQNFTRMALGSGIGAFTGQRFDGSTEPLAQGFVVSGLLALGFILWAEHGRLFTRPNRGALRPGDIPGR